MRTQIPENAVSHDYIRVLDEFVALLLDRQRENLVCALLSGSYARGEATEESDLDVYCVFQRITVDVLTDVGFCARNTSVSYEELEINTQCLGMDEFCCSDFASWSERSVKILDGVFLYGDDIYGSEVSTAELRGIYTNHLVDILMTIRHYISVDEPAEKLPYTKVKANILKPLMFALQLERYCTKGAFPLTLQELEDALEERGKRIVALLRDERLYAKRVAEDHRAVLHDLHVLICEKLGCA